MILVDWLLKISNSAQSKNELAPSNGNKLDFIPALPQEFSSDSSVFHIVLFCCENNHLRPSGKDLKIIINFYPRASYTVVTWHETKYCQRKEDDFYYSCVVRAHCLSGFQRTVWQLVVQLYAMWPAESIKTFFLIVFHCSKFVDKNKSLMIILNSTQTK